LADNTKHESITEVVTSTLTDWIDEHSDNIRQTIIGFPEANLRLKMPSVSVFAPRPEFKPSSNPYLINTVQDEDISNSKANVLWVVGDYDFNLQLDLWCGSKEELDDLFAELFEVLNPNVKPGVSLPMEDYFGGICEYIYTGHTRDNGEQASQRDEWRMTFTILATCKAIRSRKEFIIESTEIIIEANKEIILEDD